VLDYFREVSEHLVEDGKTVVETRHQTFDTLDLVEQASPIGFKPTAVGDEAVALGRGRAEESLRGLGDVEAHGGLFYRHGGLFGRSNEGAVLTRC
jgi:hypothetical protein